MEYEASLKARWDYENALAYTEQTAREEERAIAAKMIEAERAKAEAERANAEAEKMNAARKMLENNFDVQMIADILQIPIEQVEKLK